MKTKDIKAALLTNDSIIIEDLFNDIYNEYYKLLFYVSVKMTKNPDDTEELVNEAFMKAFKNLDKFDFNNSESNFKAWLVRIVKNETINFLNKKNKEPYEYLDEDLKATNSNFDKFIFEFTYLLTEEELDILIFRIEYNMKLKDIAQIIDKDINYIYNVYKRALKILKKHYTKGDFNEQN